MTYFTRFAEGITPVNPMLFPDLNHHWEYLEFTYRLRSWSVVVIQGLGRYQPCFIRTDLPQGRKPQCMATYAGADQRSMVFRLRSHSMAT